MNIRFYNAKILTMEENREIFEGEVHIQDEKILYVGENQDGAGSKMAGGQVWDREIDCKGNLLMPGFKDAHTHSGMTLLRSYADDLPLNEWLNDRIFPVEAKMTAEDIYELSKLAILEYLTSGITGVFDMYLTPDSIADAFDEMGMRCVQVGGVNNFSQSVESTPVPGSCLKESPLWHTSISLRFLPILRKPRARLSAARKGTA